MRAPQDQQIQERRIRPKGFLLDHFADGQVWPTYMAAGWGGQWIVAVPAADLVFLSTAGSWEGPEPMPARRILESYVLAGMR